MNEHDRIIYQFIGNNVFETFATTVALLYFVGYTFSLSFLIYAFSKLSTYHQRKANINLSPTALLIYLVSIAWLITMVIS